MGEKKQKEEKVAVEDLETEGEDVKGGMSIRGNRVGSASKLGNHMINKEQKLRVPPRDPQR